MKPSFFSKGDRSDFLTSKVRPKLNILDFVLGFFWVLFEGLLISASVSLLLEGNFGAAGVGASLFAPLLWPAYARIRNVVQSRRAIQVAKGLETTRAEHFSGAELCKAVSRKDARAVLKSLLEGNYLSGVTFDEQQDRVYLVRRLKLEARQFPFVCPSCGAHGVADTLKKPVCPYCGAGLTIPKEA